MVKDSLVPPTTDRLVPTRQLTEPCARCHHTAGQHHVGAVRSWEYCEAQACLCPGWCSTIECATCDYGTPRWAGYSQCLACLDYHVKPCDYVVKSVISFDTEAAIAEIRRHRREWEVKHPGWHLDLDQQRSFPESVAPSKYTDRQTTLGRKLFGSRFRVVRAHPKRKSAMDLQKQLERIFLPSPAFRAIIDGVLAPKNTLLELLGSGGIVCSGGEREIPSVSTTA